MIEELKSFWENSQKKKIQGGGVRVDVNEELKFLCKFKKKKMGGGGSGGWGWGGVRMDENEELKFFGKFKKKKLGGWGGWVHGGVRVGGSGWM